MMLAGFTKKENKQCFTEAHLHLPLSYVSLNIQCQPCICCCLCQERTPYALCKMHLLLALLDICTTLLHCQRHCTRVLATTKIMSIVCMQGSQHSPYTLPPSLPPLMWCGLHGPQLAMQCWSKYVPASCTISIVYACLVHDQ